MGIDVRTDRFGRWGQNLLLGEKLTERVFAVYARSTTITSEDLTLIGRFHALRFLVANDADITDDDLVHLSEMPRLRELTLCRSRVKGAGLAYVSRHERLEDVDLSYSELEDEGLATLARWPRLQSLTLDGTKITDAGVGQLAGHSNLERLRLSHTDITDRGLLDIVPTLPKLRSISLTNVHVTRSTLDHIAERNIDVQSSFLARSKSHRQTITQLARLRVCVDAFRRIPVSAPPEEGYTVSMGKDWELHPETEKHFQQLPDVRYVVMDSPAVDGDAIDLLACFPSLLLLQITGASINDADLVRLGNQQHPVLRLIHVEGRSVTVEGLIALGHLPALRHLSVAGIAIDETAAARLSALRQLEWIHFHRSSLDDEAVFRLRVALPHTRVSIATRNVEVESRQVSCTIDNVDRVIDELCELPALEVVTINCPKLKPDSLSKLRRLSRIRELSLYGCDFHEVDLTWLEELPNLRKLKLQGSSMDDAVSALPGNIPRVVALDISSQDSSNDWINHIGQFKGLERLRIFGQSNRPLDVAPLSGMPSLETLSITFSHFSDAHLAALVPLPQLNGLTVSGAGVTDLSIEVFATFSKLRHLNVSRTGISASGLSRLRTMFPRAEIVAEHIEPRNR